MICRPDCPQTHRTLPASNFGIKGTTTRFVKILKNWYSQTQNVLVKSNRRGSIFFTHLFHILMIVNMQETCNLESQSDIFIHCPSLVCYSSICLHITKSSETVCLVSGTQISARKMMLVCCIDLVSLLSEEEPQRNKKQQKSVLETRETESLHYHPSKVSSGSGCCEETPGQIHLLLPFCQPETDLSTQQSSLLKP